MGGPGAAGLLAGTPGERWVVRVRQDDGSATDVVGWLIGVADDVAVLEGPLDPEAPGTASPVQRVPLADVVVARRAPAALGGPAVRRTPPDVLERLGVEAWAVELDPLGDWTLRSAAGFTGRANSCLAVGDPGLPVTDAAAAVEAYAARHGIAPMAQVVTGSGRTPRCRRSAGGRPTSRRTCSPPGSRTSSARACPTRGSW